MSKLQEIFNGWGNYVRDEFNVLPPKVKIMAEMRLNLCHTCILRSGNKCNNNKTAIHIITGNAVTGCGCYLSAKALSTNIHTKCPMGKW